MMRKRKGKVEYTRSGRKMTYLGDVDDLTPEQQARADEATRLADEEDDACRVNFRWEASQLSLVKEVASKIGVPYQTYMKVVIYKQALADLQSIKQSGGHSASSERSGVAESRASKRKGRSKPVKY